MLARWTQQAIADNPRVVASPGEAVQEYLTRYSLPPLSTAIFQLSPLQPAPPLPVFQCFLSLDDGSNEGGRISVSGIGHTPQDAEKFAAMQLCFVLEERFSFRAAGPSKRKLKAEAAKSKYICESRGETLSESRGEILSESQGETLGESQSEPKCVSLSSPLCEPSAPEKQGESVASPIEADAAPQADTNMVPRWMKHVKSAMDTLALRLDLCRPQIDCEHVSSLYEATVTFAGITAVVADSTENRAIRLACIEVMHQLSVRIDFAQIIPNLVAPTKLVLSRKDFYRYAEDDFLVDDTPYRALPWYSDLAVNLRPLHSAAYIHSAAHFGALGSNERHHLAEYTFRGVRGLGRAVARNTAKRHAQVNFYRQYLALYGHGPSLSDLGEGPGDPKRDSLLQNDPHPVQSPAQPLEARASSDEGAAVATGSTRNVDPRLARAPMGPPGKAVEPPFIQPEPDAKKNDAVKAALDCVAVKLPPLMPVGLGERSRAEIERFLSMHGLVEKTEAMLVGEAAAAGPLQLRTFPRAKGMLIQADSLLARAIQAALNSSTRLLAVPDAECASQVERLFPVNVCTLDVLLQHPQPAVVLSDGGVLGELTARIPGTQLFAEEDSGPAPVVLREQLSLLDARLVNADDTCAFLGQLEAAAGAVSSEGEERLSGAGRGMDLRAPPMPVLPYSLIEGIVGKVAEQHPADSIAILLPDEHACRCMRNALLEENVLQRDYGRVVVPAEPVPPNTRIVLITCSRFVVQLLDSVHVIDACWGRGGVPCRSYWNLCWRRPAPLDQEKRALLERMYSVSKAPAPSCCLLPDGRLNGLGTLLARMPTRPPVSLMLFVAVVCSCLDPVLTIAACMHVGGTPLASRSAPCRNALSDHVFFHEAFVRWRDAHDEQRFCSRLEEEQFCAANGLDLDALRHIAYQRQALLDMLDALGLFGALRPLLATNGALEAALNLHSARQEMVRAVVAAALYPRIAIRTGGAVQTRRDAHASVHASSGVHGSRLMCFERQAWHAGTLSLIHVTTTRPIDLLLFGLYASDGAAADGRLNGWLPVDTLSPEAASVLAFRDGLLGTLDRFLRCANADVGSISDGVARLARHGLGLLHGLVLQGQQ